MDRAGLGDAGDVVGDESLEERDPILARDGNQTAWRSRGYEALGHGDRGLPG